MDPCRLDPTVTEVRRGPFQAPALAGAARPRGLSLRSERGAAQQGFAPHSLSCLGTTPERTGPRDTEGGGIEMRASHAPPASAPARPGRWPRRSPHRGLGTAGLHSYAGRGRPCASDESPVQQMQRTIQIIRPGPPCNTWAHGRNMSRQSRHVAESHARLATESSSRKRPFVTSACLLTTFPRREEQDMFPCQPQTGC
jgi:hypothetical protein